MKLLNNTLENERINLKTKLNQLENEVLEISNSLLIKNQIKKKELINILNEHKKEKDNWEKIKDIQYYKISNFEKIIRKKDLEIENLVKKFYKINELLQNSTGKVIYQTFNDFNEV